MMQFLAVFSSFVELSVESLMTKKKKIKNVWYDKAGNPHLRVTESIAAGEGGKTRRRAYMEKLDVPFDAEYVKTRTIEIKERIDRRRGGASPDPAPMNFAELTEAYARAELTPAVFRDGIKVAGRKSLDTPRQTLKMLVAHFGWRRFDQITYVEIKEFKTRRLNTKTIHGARRAISTVNRELQLLKSVFFFAIRAGWLAVHPFHSGKSLIQLSQEQPRIVLWTHAEEEQALALCTGRASHMRLVITAITNGGFRWGELSSMTWKQVDFSKREIRLAAEQTKTNKARVIPMNALLLKTFLWQLKRRDGQGKASADDLVLGVKSVKKAWDRIRLKIGRPGLQLRDLRTVCATRLLISDNPVPELVVAQLMGNSPEILRRNYAVVTNQNLRDAVERL